MVTAIILAGGVGSRVGAGRPKQFIEVLGKPVLAYTIEIFQNNPQIDAIEVVCHKKWKEYLMGMIEQYGLTSDKIVNDVIRVMKDKGSAITATPCYQLLGSNDENATSKTWVDRDKYIQIACPYGFRFDYLLNVYERAKKKRLIEKVEPHTTSLMYTLGDRLYQAYGDQTNIKITTKEDLALFEGYVLLQQRKMKL